MKHEKMRGLGGGQLGRVVVDDLGEDNLRLTCSSSLAGMGSPVTR